MVHKYLPNNCTGRFKLYLGIAKRSKIINCRITLRRKFLNPLIDQMMIFSLQLFFVRAVATIVQPNSFYLEVSNTIWANSEVHFWSLVFRRNICNVDSRPVWPGCLGKNIPLISVIMAEVAKSNDLAKIAKKLTIFWATLYSKKDRKSV